MMQRLPWMFCVSVLLQVAYGPLRADDLPLLTWTRVAHVVVLVMALNLWADRVKR